MDTDAAARQAYDTAGHTPGDRVSGDWYGRICHQHRLAYLTPGEMGPHVTRDHAQPSGYYTAEAA